MYVINKPVHDNHKVHVGVIIYSYHALCTQGVQLLIDIADDDYNNQANASQYDFIDILLINHSLPIGQESIRQNHTGIYNFVTMDLTVRAVCAENFIGADCTQCVAGYTGAMNVVTVDPQTDIKYPTSNLPDQHLNAVGISIGAVTAFISLLVIIPTLVAIVFWIRLKTKTRSSHQPQGKPGYL